jgi:hypothetical protein
MLPTRIVWLFASDLERCDIQKCFRMSEKATNTLSKQTSKPIEPGFRQDSEARCTNNARLFSPNQSLDMNTAHNQLCRIHQGHRYHIACTRTTSDTRNCFCGPCRGDLERRAL